MLKFTIITPTLLRPSLAKTLESINSQLYPNWKHIVIVDDPLASIVKYLNDNPKAVHVNRKWFQCDTNHHNVGHTCRHNMFSNIEPGTDYVIYIDDDNFYFTNALNLLNDELEERGCPPWGTFPLLTYLGRLIDDKPRLNHVDTNQIYHKPFIDSKPIQWPALNEYAGDGHFVEWLNTITPPVILNNLPELASMPVRSYGAPSIATETADPYALIIPNKFDDVIKPLIDSLKRFRAKPLHVVVVKDNHDRDYGYDSVKVDGKFIFSKSINAGINHVGRADVILLNDDIRLVELATFDHLFKVAYSDPLIGIVSPLIDGGAGNAYMDANRVNQLWKGNRDGLYISKGTAWDYVSFACVYIKRQLIDQIGLMDENFTTYGRDDADYCIRAIRAGWKVAITRNAKVRHGTGGPSARGRNWSVSYVKCKTENYKINKDYFFVKYPEYLPKEEFPHPGQMPPQRQIINRDTGKQLLKTN